MRWDILFAGGDVVDPGGGHSGRLDVAVAGGRIAAVDRELARHEAREVVDVAGRLVTPGLVDLHTHVYAGATYWGIEPDPVAWYSGVTTWVDAGSAGAYALTALRSAVAGYQVRVPVLLNIAAEGLIGPTGEDHYDVDLAIATVLGNRDLVAGVKVRMDRATGGRLGLEPLRRAVEVAQASAVPLMVHIGQPPPAVGELVPLLRPGDIITHCASGLADGGGALADAYAAGVLFDLGHGSGSFAFDVLEAQLKADLVPHAISTDLNARCLYGPVFDLPTTMAKLLAVGLPLDQVVAAATVGPARALGLPGGTLSIGAPADIAVFTVEDGDVELVDAHRQRRRAGYRLVNEATYVAGRPLPPLLPAAPAPWVPITPAQRKALSARTRAIRDLLAAPLVGADGLAEQFPRS